MVLYFNFVSLLGGILLSILPSCHLKVLSVVMAGDIVNRNKGKQPHSGPKEKGCCAIAEQCSWK